MDDDPFLINCCLYDFNNIGYFFNQINITLDKIKKMTNFTFRAYILGTLHKVRKKQ